MICVVLLVISSFIIYSYYADEYNRLVERYNELANEMNDVSKRYQEFRNAVFCEARDNCTALTIVYYTNFSKNQQIMSLSVPYEKYDTYHKIEHPYWGSQNLTSAIEYISSNETIIKQIVLTIRNQTNSEEELANALLDFVQDKGHSLSIRYYPTFELKYPVETLVEMGGDCDTHSVLYATLMKAAGFKVLLLYSNKKLSDGQYHVATAIHLANPPENSLPDYADSSYTYGGEEYYYAETTMSHWRVGDLPTKYKDVTFRSLPV